MSRQSSRTTGQHASAGARPERGGGSMTLYLAVLILLPLGLETLARLVGLPFPGSVAGYMLLLAWLASRKSVPGHLTPVADALVKLLPLCLVPPALGILDPTMLRPHDILPLALAIIVGTLAGLSTTAIVFRWLLRLRGRRTTARDGTATAEQSYSR